VVGTSTWFQLRHREHQTGSSVSIWFPVPQLVVTARGFLTVKPLNVAILMGVVSFVPKGLGSGCSLVFRDPADVAGGAGW
jgi:hypothetical protein